MLGEGAKVADRFHGARHARRRATSRRSPFIATEEFGAEGPHRRAGRLRQRRGRHRRRAHLDLVRRGRLPDRPGAGHRRHQPGQARRHLRRADGPVRRPAGSRTPTRASSRTCASAGGCSSEEAYLHAYPHCWRCGTPLLYYAKPSWYIRTSSLRDRLLAANESVDWHPEHIKHGRMGKWLENNVDWAISRERYWGTPLPVWRNEAGETMAIGSLAELEQLSGVKLDDPHRPYVDDVEIPSPTGGEPLRRVPEVIDVWFDSGSMPFAQWHAPHENEEHFEERFPADYICEAIDQTRGWFYSLLAISTLLFDQSPYRTCLVLGHIADEQGTQDVEVAREHRRAVGRHRQARGRRVPLVLLHLEVPVGRLPVLRRHGRRVAAPVPAPALEHVRLPRPLHERQRRHRARASRPPTSTAGRCRGCTRPPRPCASGSTPTTPRAPATRSPRSSTSCRTGTCAARRARFWDGDPAAFGTLHTCLVTVAKLLAPFCPFIADEIYDNLDGSEPSVHLCDFPEAGPARRRARGGDGGRARERAARPRRPRAGQARRAPAAARRRGGGRRRRARGDRAARGHRQGRAQRQGAALRLAGRRARLLRGQAQLPRARPALRQAHAAGGGRGGRARPRPTSPTPCATAAASASASTGTTTSSTPTTCCWRCSRSRATSSSARARTRSRSSSSSTTSWSARASRARSSTRSRTRARRPASRSPTGSSSRSAATTSCSTPRGRSRTT